MNLPAKKKALAEYTAKGVCVVHACVSLQALAHAARCQRCFLELFCGPRAAARLPGCALSMPLTMLRLCACPGAGPNSACLAETHPFYSLRQAGATPVEMSTAGAAVKDDRLTVTVDGMQVKVPPGISVLQARTAHRALKNSGRKINRSRALRMRAAARFRGQS